MKGQAAWRKAPLQARFFGSLRAGEALWDRIAEVLHQPLTESGRFDLLSPCDSAGLSGIIQPESGQPVAEMR